MMASHNMYNLHEISLASFFLQRELAVLKEVLDSPCTDTSLSVKQKEAVPVD